MRLRRDNHNYRASLLYTAPGLRADDRLIVHHEYKIINQRCVNGNLIIDKHNIIEMIWNTCSAYY